MSGWDASKHPRTPKGSPGGGEFASQAGGELKSGYYKATYPDGSWAIWKGRNPSQAAATGSKTDSVPATFFKGGPSGVKKDNPWGGKNTNRLYTPRRKS